MNRKTLKRLTQMRLDDARVLYKNRQYAGAYYIAGYAMECALKACIAKTTLKHDFPDKHRASESFTHDLAKLLNLAGLKVQLDQDGAAMPPLGRNWAVVKDWNEKKRYDDTIDQKAARDFLRAIRNQKAGLLKWVRRHW